MELADTVEMMLSKDFRERFKAEYYQTEIRYRKLVDMLAKWDNGGLNFTPSCSKSILKAQADTMSDYLKVLEARAYVERIDLPWERKSDEAAKEVKPEGEGSGVRE